MKIRTIETIAAGLLPLALGIFVAVWNHTVGPLTSTVALAATAIVIVAEFGIIRRRWNRGEKA